MIGGIEVSGENTLEEPVNIEVEYNNDYHTGYDNILRWHHPKPRDLREFKINGFIDMYPDFIIVTESGKILMVETKGDHLDNEDTAKKNKLGNMWFSEANKTGKEYEYYLVFERKRSNDTGFTIWYYSFLL